MKKALTIFFTTLGVIFFILLVAAAWFFLADPYNLRPLLFGSGDIQMQEDGSNSRADKNPLLNESQERQLESLGIDPATLPSEITPEMERCLIDAVGAERAAEIEAGDSPSATEFFKSRRCLE